MSAAQQKALFDLICQPLPESLHTPLWQHFTAAIKAGDPFLYALQDTLSSLPEQSWVFLCCDHKAPNELIWQTKAVTSTYALPTAFAPKNEPETPQEIASAFAAWLQPQGYSLMVFNTQGDNWCGFICQSKLTKPAQAAARSLALGLEVVATPTQKKHNFLLVTRKPNKEKNLASMLQKACIQAKRKKLRPLLFVKLTGCSCDLCQLLNRHDDYPALHEAFSGYYLIQISALHWLHELAKVGLSVHDASLFAPVSDTGEVLGPVLINRTLHKEGVSCEEQARHIQSCFQALATPHTRQLNTEQKEAALRAAISSDDLPKLRELVAQGINIQALSAPPNSSLLWHLGNDPAIAEYLLDAGIDINPRNKHQQTPLNAALHHNHRTLAALLLTRGADINLYPEGAPTLHTIVSHNHLELIELYDLKACDHLNGFNRQGMAPLHLAVACGHLCVVKQLVEAGAQVNQKDDKHLPPLAHINKRTDPAIYSYLVSQGADPDLLGAEPCYPDYFTNAQEADLRQSH